MVSRLACKPLVIIYPRVCRFVTVMAMSWSTGFPFLPREGNSFVLPCRAVFTR